MRKRWKYGQEFRISTVSQEYGKKTFKRLKDFVDELRKKGESLTTLLCSLILDEMYMRKKVYFDPNSFDYIGYPTFPLTESCQFTDFDYAAKENCAEKRKKKQKEKCPLATRALVFL